MTTYRCPACSTVLKAEKFPIEDVVEVELCEACIEAAVEVALDAADVKDFEEEELRKEIQKILGMLWKLK